MLTRCQTLCEHEFNPVGLNLLLIQQVFYVYCQCHIFNIVFVCKSNQLFGKSILCVDESVPVPASLDVLIDKRHIRIVQIIYFGLRANHLLRLKRQLSVEGFFPQRPNDKKGFSS